MKYLNVMGINDPAISFSAEDDTKIIYLMGKVFEPVAENLPFDTTGDWSADNVNFTEIVDISDLSAYDDPTEYLHLRETTAGDMAALPSGVVKEVMDEVIDGPSALQLEQAWIRDEFTLADDQIRYHYDADSRAVATEAEWKQFRCDLRDRVVSEVIMGDRPTRPA